MTSGKLKLCLAMLLGGAPAVATAQVHVDVGLNVGVDSYDTAAPGDPVESVDVFYDQLSPYGVWVDEPDVGRVYVPDTASYVPYTNGHWQYTNLGFVWVSSEPFAWATSHYGRWAYSQHYGRWYWLPDTEWGPAWVEWRETGSDFGWAPLAPEVVVRAGWQVPVESWHYCSAEHVLDANLVRYYEPRERVVEIHRQAHPLEHYSTVSNVKVVVGPPAARLREHHVTVHPVRVEARTVGRWTPTEAHAQVSRARDHRAAFEATNQHRIDSNAHFHAAQVKVIETHPQIKTEIDARVHVGARPAEPSRDHRTEPEHAAPRPSEPRPNERPNEHVIVPHETKPPQPAPQHEVRPQQPSPPQHEVRPQPAPQHEARPQQPPPPQHEARPQPQAAPKAPEPQRAPEQHAQPQEKPHGNEPPRGEHKEPDHKEPDHKQPDHKDDHR